MDPQTDDTIKITLVSDDRLVFLRRRQGHPGHEVVDRGPRAGKGEPGPAKMGATGRKGGQGQDGSGTETEIRAESMEAAVSNDSFPPGHLGDLFQPQSLASKAPSHRKHIPAMLDRSLVATLTSSSVHPAAGVEPSSWAEQRQDRRGVNSV